MESGVSKEEIKRKIKRKKILKRKEVGTSESIKKRDTTKGEVEGKNL